MTDSTSPVRVYVYFHWPRSSPVPTGTSFTVSRFWRSYWNFVTRPSGSVLSVTLPSASYLLVTVGATVSVEPGAV